MRCLSAILLLLAAGLSSAAIADGPLPAPLADGGTATVTAVVDGDTVALDDGREVRLVGLQAPKLPLGRPGFVAWPLADEAKAALERLTLGRSVRLGHGGRETDRYRRALAHLFLDDGTWIQEALLAAGLARVYTFADNRALAARLYAAEAQARAVRRGIWAHPYYAIIAADDAGSRLDEFALVEGRVLEAAVVRGRAYLNFGVDWKRDFTVSAAPADVKIMRRDGFDPAALAGRRVRVRGWVKWLNGPMIDLTHPEQIEVLAE
ncbi:MAG: thermonuclease family protein [Alphaproteobacteria bacterium]